MSKAGAFGGQLSGVTSMVSDETRASSGPVVIERMQPGRWRLVRDTFLWASVSDPARRPLCEHQIGVASETGAEWIARLECDGWWLAFADGVVIGIVGVAPQHEQTDVLQLVIHWVAPPWRSRGIGRQLLLAAQAGVADTRAGAPRPGPRT
ncbi:GNAT family N-acetyltransferase [Nocardioides mesophilus]|uniref:GNAT family N-acetyltransferase n=1 Tax=Nocardioides mesophilus TaxID=433659 RepID=A0A7G9RAP9_9ACTN|nr:GNAT family N-acetyltransferase [Nocardioides mesophilus]QNN52674.1 GNAT family N-acetyltransferase [Nocardioides mesophilus]